MLDLILNPSFVLLMLALLAVGTPLGGIVAASKKRELRKPPHRRKWLLASTTGPLLLALWGVHNLVLTLVGFDSVFSVTILLAVFVGAGYGIGRWLRAPGAAS